MRLSYVHLAKRMFDLRQAFPVFKICDRSAFQPGTIICVFFPLRIPLKMVATGQEMVRKSQEILSMIREAYDISVYSY